MIVACQQSAVPYKLFIDDERFPIDDSWIIARSSSDAIYYVQREMPTEISFDHDLGGDDTSRIFISWLTCQLVDGVLLFPPGFKFHVHSQNSVGAEYIKGTMDSLVLHFSVPYSNL